MRRWRLQFTEDEADSVVLFNPVIGLVRDQDLTVAPETDPFLASWKQALSTYSELFGRPREAEHTITVAFSPHHQTKTAIKFTTLEEHSPQSVVADVRAHLKREDLASALDQVLEGLYEWRKERDWLKIRSFLSTVASSDDLAWIPEVLMTALSGTLLIKNHAEPERGRLWDMAFRNVAQKHGEDRARRLYDGLM